MSYVHVCALCGKSFESNRSNSRICKDKHFYNCVICGKQFEIHSVEHAKTCSEKCRRAAISKTEHSKLPSYRCVCKECGSEFFARSPLATVCDNEHIKVCKVCGKPFKASKQQILSGTQTCSDKCRYKLMGDSFSKSCGIQAPAEAHQVYQAKYKAGLMKSYGVTNPMQSDIIKQKSKQTSLERYGNTSFTRTELYLEKAKKTNRERYGVDWHAQTDEHRMAVKATCKKKYGADNASKSFEEISRRMHDPSKAVNWSEFRENPNNYIKNHHIENPTLNMLESELGVRASSISEYLRRYKDIGIVSLAYSNMEDEVYQFLLDIGFSEKDIIRNTKNEISPYELDVFIPRYRFAIECNPTATHNSSKEDPWGSDPKSWRYHQMKTDMCEELGIQLFHIFGYEWTHKQDIIKSMLKNALNKTHNKVYARNTTVKEVPWNESIQFLNKNHRQGRADSKFRYGLYLDEELVALMTFGKKRSTIGSDYGDNTYELVRFCNKLDTSIIGGASKLLNYFVSNIHPNCIISYSDRAHTKGHLYEVLGFVECIRSEPGYVWVCEKNDLEYNRMNAQKRNIKKFLHDESIDLSLSETEIMESHGFVKVYDSGTITWRKEIKNE